MLSKILSNAVSNSDLCKATNDSEAHFLQEKSNSAKSLYLSSLNVLVGNGVLNMSMTENVARSGLGLNHLKIVYRRAGEDGLRNVICAKNVHGKPRVTNSCKV